MWKEVQEARLKAEEAWKANDAAKAATIDAVGSATVAEGEMRDENAAMEAAQGTATKATQVHQR
jgi:hypothetical protein